LALAGRKKAIDVPLQPPKLLLSCTLENRHDVLSPAGADGIGSKHGRFSPKRHDLAADPLEILTTLIRVRQHVDGVPGRYRTDLLQTTPRLDPSIRRARRELMAQQEPSRLFHETYVTR
jgi:hypothetical protein